MPTYQYEALDATTGKEVKGTIEAANPNEAQTLIKQKQYFVTKLTERTVKATKSTKTQKVGRKRKKSFTIGGLSNKKLCLFTRQLSTLQDAGLPILRSLKILENQAKPGVLKNVLGDVVEDIESGSTLSEAMAKHPKAFDRLYCNMIKAGEAGGALETILQRLADFKEKAQSLRRRIKGAMVYPIVVIFVAFVIVGFILYFIIPKFEAIFKDFDVDLPQMTIWLIEASHIIIEYAPLVILSPVFFWLFIKLLYKMRWGAYMCDWILLRIPVLGQIAGKSTVARTMRTLGTLVQSGVPILESLNIVRDTAGNAVYERAFTKVYESIREGETIAQPLKEARVVDDIVINMIDVGEETGDLDTMLMKIADNYEEEVETLVESLVSLLEPVMIVVLGGIIGFIVIALFLPLIQLITKLSG
ncbi:Type II secretion system F domain protein [Isosphaera pallida ATCC 43644]|uniref:Type II secretion system F domain protein n=1 Tax=Isosphaera pallida (strain ATCC 43644 / DSM 9630 / IS1B) TaxID=575540 RepID=E8R137_ISOPI|nr:type II secretion system F family protein [Isosphaera pallida]ADV63388.1 Type II secretion system F domain protein [Isosphaera pallida ATCC 43644]